MHSKTFRGKTWRMQLTVHDFTDSPISQWRNDPIKFSISRLRASDPASQSFSTGAIMAMTTDLTHCLLVIEAHIHRDPISELPKVWLKKYGAKINLS